MKEIIMQGGKNGKNEWVWQKLNQFIWLLCEELLMNFLP
jgi:hypothetical protein